MSENKPELSQQEKANLALSQGNVLMKSVEMPKVHLYHVVVVVTLLSLCQLFFIHRIIFVGLVKNKLIHLSYAVPLSFIFFSGCQDLRGI
jgi:hypothetical protein